jgi:predicted choloylglycine hydrolase
MAIERDHDLREPLPTPDYRYFDLAGSHAMLGYELGKADGPFTMQRWWFPPPDEAFARDCAEVVRDLHPHLLDEFAAYADAQERDADALWRQCCRVHLKARIRAQESAEGCSTFWRALPDGRAIVGRNYDYWPMQTRRQRIRFSPDCCAISHVGARGGVPCGRYDGVNAHGVFVSLHVVMTDTPDAADVAPGVPFHLVARLVLEICRTAREARDVLLDIPHISSLNFLAADAREAFVIEADPRRVRALEPTGDNTVVAATNHYRHPDMRPLQGRRQTANSECRLDFMARQTLDATQTTDALLDQAERVMADRGAPLRGDKGALTTLWSCVAELSASRIRYAPGAPGSVAFEALEL